MTKLDKAKALQGKICTQVNGLDISLWEISDIKVLAKELNSYLNGKTEDEKEGAAESLWNTFYISDDDFDPEIIKTLLSLVTEFLTLDVDTADLEEVTMTTVNSIN
jgi:hypothetical protein